MKAINWLQEQLKDQPNTDSVWLVHSLDNLGQLAQTAPSLFLLPEKERAEPSQNLVRFEQKIYSQFALVLVMQVPKVGHQQDQQLFWEVLHQSRKAILGKVPPHAIGQIEYLDGEYHPLAAQLSTWVDHYQYTYISSTL